MGKNEMLIFTNIIVKSISNYTDKDLSNEKQHEHLIIKFFNTLSLYHR